MENQYHENYHVFRHFSYHVKPRGRKTILKLHVSFASGGNQTRAT